jgi:hypothetical protein
MTNEDQILINELIKEHNFWLVKNGEPELTDAEIDVFKLGFMAGRASMLEEMTKFKEGY